MSGSPYDDRVMALALANQMRKYAYEPEYMLRKWMTIGLLIGLLVWVIIRLNLIRCR